MALTTGTRLGPYEVVAPLGAGGMGEVYRARDPRMGREVAIKVSAERFSDRFEREVRAVAALNHPNICHIYDVGSDYLVMELVEGSTLAERLAKGPMPIDEAIPIAKQIAEALEAAHEHGIIHRDLKPANIKIKPDGVVKVLDFGLAKMAEPAAPSGTPESSLTIPMGVTEVGQIMGTAAYMSPEQARGKTVDKRADIWAFGVVLHEMLTGRRLFEGETVSDTLASVLTKEPRWEHVPARMQRLLNSCLEKDPNGRLRDIGDAWRLVEEVPAPAANSTTLWKLATAVSALAFAIALWAPWRRTVPPTDQPSTRLDLELGPDVSLEDTAGPSVILSPDGTRLIFVSRGQDGLRRLFTRPLDQPKTTPLPKTEGAYEPFFSPDGQWVGFFAQGKLKKTRIDGGEPVSLCDAPAGRGASWGEDGNIVAALDPQTPLSQVPSGGGNVVPISKLEPGEDSHRWPYLLPGGKGVLFTVSTVSINFDEAGVAVLSLEDHQRKTLLDHVGMSPRYLPSGHLVYVTKGAVFAVPFDLDRLEVHGAATRLEEVSTDTSRGFAQADFARNGLFAFRTGGSEGLSTLHWLDSAGGTESLGTEAARYSYPRLSPDGTRLAYIATQGSNSDLWTYDWQRGIKTRLTNGLVATDPVWSPDGRFIVFQSIGGMFWTQADGAGAVQQLTRSKTRQRPSSFSLDGMRLAFTELTAGAGGDVRTVTIETASGQIRAGQAQSFVKTSTLLSYPAFSPDGRWLAFANAEAGRYEVYVRAFPDRGMRVQISNAGGTMPVWSRNGHELFYRTEDQRIMVANYIVKGESFIADKPRVWFSRQLANVGMAVNLNLAPDGKRFIVLLPAESTEAREQQNHVTLVVNFFDEIRRRVAGQQK